MAGLASGAALVPAAAWDRPRPRSLAAAEIGRRLARGVFERAAIGTPAAVASYLALRYAVRDQEVMGALYVDTRHRLLAERELYRGTVNRIAVEPRAILKEGLLHGACGVVLFHTHPSGDPSPSAEDLAFTRRMAEAGEVVGIRLVDHLILGAVGRWSLARARRMVASPASWKRFRRRLVRIAFGRAASVGDVRRRRARVRRRGRGFAALGRGPPDRRRRGGAAPPNICRRSPCRGPRSRPRGSDPACTARRPRRRSASLSRSPATVRSAGSSPR
ncbi:MAG: JAB domain-containing protein [Thermoanaerobaculia bacterium]